MTQPTESVLTGLCAGGGALAAGGAAARAGPRLPDEGLGAGPRVSARPGGRWAVRRGDQEQHCRGRQGGKWGSLLDI